VSPLIPKACPKSGLSAFHTCFPEVPQKKKCNEPRNGLMDVADDAGKAGPERMKKKPSSLKKQIIQVRTDPSAVQENDQKTRLEAFLYRQPHSDEMDSLALGFLGEVKHFQDRLWHKDPTKGRSKRRIVCGFRETLKAVRRNDAKCVILSRQFEWAGGPGGIVEQMTSIIAGATTSPIQVPLIFISSSRSRLARAVNKFDGTVACVAVLNYEGAQDIFEKLQHLLLKEMHHFALSVDQIDQASLFA